MHGIYKIFSDEEALYLRAKKLGIQSKIREPGEGYCVMYSYFWLFLVLFCYMENPNIDIQYLFLNIEETLLSLYSTDDFLAEIITSFAIRIVHNYMIDIGDLLDRESLKTFYLDQNTEFQKRMEKRKLFEKKDILTYKHRKPRQEGEKCITNKQCGSGSCINVIENGKSKRVCGPSK